MLKKSLVTAALALAVAAWATPASAVSITFDPTGTAGAVGDRQIDVFDPTVGNSIALNANAGSPVGSDVTALFQANLTKALLNGADVDLGGAHFTVVAGFHETVTQNVPGFIRLDLDPTKASFFDIYATTGDDLSGTGFVGGTLILSGVFINSGAPGDGISTFATTSIAGGVALDAHNANDYLGVNTITGQGAFNTTVLITGKNANYFPDLQLNTTLALVTSELKLNYTQADPSACFSSNGTVGCNQAGVSSVGAVNGLGVNTMFQTDASAAFANVTAVPEPATLTLLGIGGLLAARRRRNQAK
jgi:hypothetical protein